MTGKPNLARMKKTIPKIRVIHTIRPKSGVMRDIAYLRIRQTTIANRQAPSMRALTMIAVMRKWSAFSGWRAPASRDAVPMRLIP